MLPLRTREQSKYRASSHAVVIPGVVPIMNRVVGSVL